MTKSPRRRTRNEKHHQFRTSNEFRAKNKQNNFKCYEYSKIRLRICLTVICPSSSTNEWHTRTHTHTLRMETAHRLICAFYSLDKCSIIGLHRFFFHDANYVMVCNIIMVNCMCATKIHSGHLFGVNVNFNRASNRHYHISYLICLMVFCK